MCKLNSKPLIHLDNNESFSTYFLTLSSIKTAIQPFPTQYQVIYFRVFWLYYEKITIFQAKKISNFKYFKISKYLFITKTID